MIELDYNERFTLISESIRAHWADTLNSIGFDEFFNECFVYMIGVLDYYEIKASKKNLELSEEEELQDNLYGRIADYNNSFLNPEYAVSKLGKIGGILSCVYADIYFLPVYAAGGRMDVLTVYMELLMGIHTSIKFCIQDGEDATDLIEEYVAEFFKDYTEIFISDACLDTIDSKRNRYKSIIAKADLSDERYLYEYGLPIGENEKTLVRFLNSLSDEEISLMADTFVEGYRKGFEMSRKDISIKNVVAIEYPLGFERMIKKAIEGFNALGFDVTMPIAPVLSITGRGSRLRGVHTNETNRQFIYDHKDDKGYYYDKEFVNRRLEVMKDTYENNKELAASYGGPAVIEEFGKEHFTPINKPEARRFDKNQDELNTYDLSQSGIISNSYIPGSEYSYTIISFPIPEIGEDFEAIFKKTLEINTLSYDLYLDIQSSLINELDKGEGVRILGKGDNKTNLYVKLHKLNNPNAETNFENCVADVNIPVGEVFTSPVLKGTSGVLHVSFVYLGNYRFDDLIFNIEDGFITDYTCSNFDSEDENKKLIFENILYRHESLPMGEFAIGTNTIAYRMARDFDIGDKLPILIAEKCGPHFAFGDTCYSHAEELKVYNPDDKEIIARENECSAKRDEDPSKAYFNCHTDITIPFDELGLITVICEDGSEIDIIKDGLFVVEGAKKLNEPLA